MNERAADIASDVNRAAAGIGGAIANGFMPGSGPLIGMAGNAISSIVDRESGRAERERAAKAKADAEERAAQAKAEREEFNRRQDLLDEAARREAKRRAMTRPRDRVSWTDRADRVRAQGLDPAKLSTGDIDRVIRYFGAQTGMSAAQLDDFIAGRMNAGRPRSVLPRGPEPDDPEPQFVGNELGLPTDRESLARYRAALARPEGRDAGVLRVYQQVLDQTPLDASELPRPPADRLQQEEDRVPEALLLSVLRTAGRSTARQPSRRTRQVDDLGPLASDYEDLRAPRSGTVSRAERFDRADRLDFGNLDRGIAGLGGDLTRRSAGASGSGLDFSSVDRGIAGLGGDLGSRGAAALDDGWGHRDGGLDFAALDQGIAGLGGDLGSAAALDDGWGHRDGGLDFAALDQGIAGLGGDLAGNDNNDGSEV